MGLSGRKTKQRIPDDPRNLCWADGKGVLISLIFSLNRLFSSLDAARFGSNYLAKFGWDGSTGLGAAGEGRRSHIKVSHKLDLLGIGAAQQKDPDGIAWKQNKDFERLLQRLNDEATTAESNQTLEVGKKEEEEVNEKDCVTKKKRKHREDGEFKTERKKKRKAYMNIDNEGQSSSNTESATIQPEKIETTAVKKAVIVPRHRAQVKSLSFVALYMLIYQKNNFSHRARAINAKNMSSKSAAHISEILGIAPTPSSHLSERPQVKLTSLTNELEIEKITTSTKSVADYFKEKLNARSFSSTIVSASTPRDSDDSYDTPRMGLGSRAPLENLTAIGEVERETQRMGLLTFPAFSSSLAFEKTLKDEGSATTQMNANLNSQTKDLKKQKEKKTKDEEMENGDGAGENDGTKEREERRRKRKLDKDPQGDLKKQEKRERKAEKLLVSVTSPHTDTPVDEEKPQKERKERKKGSKSR
jgi:Pin2-interacting protein X1